MDPAGPPVEPVMPVPPMDGTADHPDHYIPEPVRHFLPYFHKQVMEKVCMLLSVVTMCCSCSDQSVHLLREKQCSP